MCRRWREDGSSPRIWEPAPASVRCGTASASPRPCRSACSTVWSCRRAAEPSTRGVLLYLARQGKSFEEIEDLLYRHSGLLASPGISGDMRALIAATTRMRARRSTFLLPHRLRDRGIDGCSAASKASCSPPGSENGSKIRADICDRLGWLGVRIDATANAANATRIGAPGSNIDVRSHRHRRGGHDRTSYHGSCGEYETAAMMSPPRWIS